MDDEKVERGLKAVFRRQPESVLDVIERLVGSSARVFLREAPEEDAPVVLTPAEAAPDDPRYQMQGEIARGGVGVVYQGRDRDLGRTVALKVLRKEYAEHAHIRQRFVEEAQIGGQLQHPGIVPVYGLGVQEDGRPCFAMKLVKGRTLAALLQARDGAGAEQRRFLSLFEQVCQTVAYAHARGVIHRDLKPSNVMVGAFGEVQVVDWGFAKVLARTEERPPDVSVIATVRSEREGSQSVAGAVMGTPAYMAPEQALGQVDLLDERADVFALGAILCEILTGQPPYEPNDLVAAAQGLLGAPLERLERCGAEAELVALARRCLAPDRGARPHDAAEVAAAIAAIHAAAEERVRQAEIEAVETRARAERARVRTVQERARVDRERARAAAEEARGRAARQARRRSLAVAAALFVAIAVTGGIYTLSAREREARSRRTGAQVAALLQEAQLLRSRGETAAAHAAAHNALGLARGGGADHRILGEALDLMTALEGDLRLAEQEAAQAASDAALLERLEWIRMLESESAAAWVDRECLAALESYGLDFLESTPEEVAARLRSRGEVFAFEVALTLNLWAARAPERKERLLETAKLADPDPWRDRLRDVLARDALDELHALAQEPASELSPQSAALLGAALLSVDLHAAAKFLRRAVRRYPGDVWLNYSAGRAIGYLRQGAALQSVPYLRAALAPEGREIHHVLGQALERIDAHEAVAVWEQALRRWPDDTHLTIHLGAALLEARRYDEGLAKVREALARAPKDWWGHDVLSRELLRRGEREEARREALVALELAPQYTFGLIQLLRDLGYRSKALPGARALVAQQPLSSETRAILADLLWRAGDLEAAIGEAKAAVRLEPTSTFALATLAEALLASGRREEALVTQRRALELDPSDEDQFTRLTSMLMGVGDFDGAEEIAREAIRRYPDAANGYNALGNALHAKGSREEALAAYREGLEKEPDSALLHYNLGNCLGLAGDGKAAEAAYRRVLEISRASPNPRALDTVELGARNNLAGRLMLTGRWEEAVEILQRALAIAGEEHEYTAHILANLGETHYRAGDPERSIELRRRALALRPGDPEMHRVLGAVLAETGRYGEATAVLGEALSRFPRNPSLLNELAWFLTTCGDWSRRDPHEAARLARLLVEVDPSNANGWGTLGAALCCTGEFEEAERAVRRSIEIGGIDAFDLAILARAQHGRGLVEEARRTLDRVDPATLHVEARRYYEEAREVIQ